MPTLYSWIMPSSTASAAPEYSWTLTDGPAYPSVPLVLPNIGPYVPSTPMFKGSKSSLFERVVKFGNVPGGRADNVVHGGTRVWHVNTLENIRNQPQTLVTDVNGAIKFKFRRYGKAGVPSTITRVESRSIDRFTNPVFSFTGTYPIDQALFYIGNGTFVTRANMNEARWLAAPSRWTGSPIMVFGGIKQMYFDPITHITVCTPTSGAESYSTASNQWSVLADMPSPRIGASAYLDIANEKVHVIGGVGSIHSASLMFMTSSYALNITGSTWSVNLESIIYPYFESEYYLTRYSSVLLSQSAVANDYEILLVGMSGSMSGSVASLIFNMNTLSWGSASILPLSGTSLNRFTVTLLLNGDVMLIGGFLSSPGIALTSSFRYTRSNNTWALDSNMPFAAYGHRTARMQDGRLLVQSIFSDTPGTIRCMVYNPNTRTWLDDRMMPFTYHNYTSDIIPYDNGGQGRMISFGALTTLPGTTSDVLTRDNEFSAYTTASIYNALSGSDIDAWYLGVNSSVHSFLVAGGLSGSNGLDISGLTRRYETMG